jgi:SAM-dependent methyltransferase
MRLAALRRHWERLGREDPYWAVLTDPDKRGGRWNPEEFFRSGAAEIDSVLARAAARGFGAVRRRALDFGCGAGRLTQSLATHFDRADGVDISAPMIEIAERHNRHADRCHYHLNVAPDLSLFPDATFDFVYTTLVLQHMAPRHSARYVGELVRVLSPSGLLVFQLPATHSSEDAPPGARRSASKPLVPEAFAAATRTLTPIPTLAPGQSIGIEVIVENRSVHTWPSLPGTFGRYQINVGNRWLHEDGQLLQRDDGRCPFDYDLDPGAHARVTLVVTAPAEDGVYLLEIDLVQEDVGWFGDRSGETLRVPVVVGNGLALPRRAPKPAPAPAPTFRQRHPEVFRVLQATGIRDGYWAWRRAVDRARAAVSVPRLINWWRRGPLSARMEMYCVPRDEVIRLVSNAGGRIVDVEQELTPGYRSCRYWVTKG